MKSLKIILWTIGGIGAATAGILIWNRRCNEPVEELAHRLESAWADNHTAS